MNLCAHKPANLINPLRNTHTEYVLQYNSKRYRMLFFFFSSLTPYSDTGYLPQLTSETIYCVEALFRCVKVQCSVVKTCFYYVGEQLNFPLNIHACFWDHLSPVEDWQWLCMGLPMACQVNCSILALTMKLVWELFMHLLDKWWQKQHVITFLFVYSTNCNWSFVLVWHAGGKYAQVKKNIASAEAKQKQL